MRYELLLAPDALRDVQHLKAHVRSTVRDAIKQHLCDHPTQVSRSRIKRLQGVSRPQFHLRIGEIRVFYDVRESTVEILAVVPKSEAGAWLKREGIAR